jgi:hypothetical protein
VLFFIIVGRPVVVFGDQSLSSFFSDPHTGYKSKRIFLSADLAFDQSIQPVLDAT